MSGDEHRRIASGRVFQARGPATAKARSPSVERHVAAEMHNHPCRIIYLCWTNCTDWINV